MRAFQIIAAGTDMGTWSAESADLAIEAMCEDAGYASVADAAEVLSQTVEQYLADLRVVEVDAAQVALETEWQIDISYRRALRAMTSRMEACHGRSGR
jgi:hypothetical protein